jgi:hypothetical protein
MVRSGLPVTWIVPDEVMQLSSSLVSLTAFPPSAHACARYVPGVESSKTVSISRMLKAWPLLSAGTSVPPFRSFLALPSVGTRKYLVREAPAWTFPRFLTWEVTYSRRGAPVRLRRADTRLYDHGDGARGICSCCADRPVKPLAVGAGLHL